MKDHSRKYIQVKSFTRKNGTVVRSYLRRNPYYVELPPGTVIETFFKDKK